MAVEPASSFTSTVSANTAPASAKAIPTARAEEAGAAYEAPTTAARNSSARGATLSTVASGEADQAREQALPAPAKRTAGPLGRSRQRPGQRGRWRSRP